MCGCENNSIQMVVGETRQIELEICCTDGVPIVQDASYALQSGSAVAAQGQCEINGSTLTLLLSPAVPNVYDL